MIFSHCAKILPRLFMWLSFRNFFIYLREDFCFFFVNWMKLIFGTECQMVFSYRPMLSSHSNLNTLHNCCDVYGSYSSFGTRLDWLRYPTKWSSRFSLYFDFPVSCTIRTLTTRNNYDLIDNFKLHKKNNFKKKKRREKEEENAWVFISSYYRICFIFLQFY